MKIITVANQKGGVGKSTLSMHIGHFAKENNLRVLYVDLDPQGNSGPTLGKQYPNIKPAFELFQNDFKYTDDKNDFLIFSSQKDKRLSDLTGDNGNFKKNLSKLDKYFDICVIDTPPTAGFLQVIAVENTDYVISPLELHDWSYAGLTDFLTLVQNLKQKQVDKPVFLGLLFNRVWKNSTSQKNDLETFKTNEGFKSNLFMKGEVVIPLREIYIKSTKTGLPVWQFKDNSSARAEGKNIKKICKEILQQMKVEV
ncbi:ParA family protein [Acinetobacter baumannii]|uniref:ParA family protein n=1 Tax=Acinetobacter baumannii TaxID=470 RepID=UPI003B436872